MVRRKLVVTAEGQDFDTNTLQQWRDEGFDVSYLTFNGQVENNINALERLADPRELGQRYAVVAFGGAASKILDMAQKPMYRISALVAYYPTVLPSPDAGNLFCTNVLVHYAGPQKTISKYRCYSYDVEPGFVEKNLKAYDKVATHLAWSRTLATLRKGFEIEVDLEKIWEDHVELEFATKDAEATMATMVAEPYVNHIPTSTGGIGYKDLYLFYRDYFIPGNPPSLKIRLLSRTVGTDRVVDEMHVSFRHTQVIPWMLPDVEPTHKEVEVALVAIVCIRGGKLYHEHIYWDQASVLVQIGLLDPKLGNGACRLPVVGAAGARKVMDNPVWKATGL